jgi:hypothetical protein
MLFLSKFLGGCTFTFLCAAYLFGGVWLLLGLRLGIWHQGILLSIPIYVFVFAIYFTVSAIAGVIWRNSIVSVIVAVVFWGMCWLVGTVEWALDSVSLQLFRIDRLATVGGDIPLYVDNRDEVYAWSKRDGAWMKALDDDYARTRELGLRMIGPVYDKERGQVSAIRSNLAGRQMLVTALRDERWAPRQVGQAPLFTQHLFQEPGGDLLALSGIGTLHRVPGDPLEALRRIEAAGSEQPKDAASETDASDAAGDADSAVAAIAQRLNVFVPAGPKEPIASLDPFAVAMHPTRRLLATYSRGEISLYKAGDGGIYDVALRKRLPGNEALPVVMAAAKEHLVIARADGKVLLVSLDNLTVEKEFKPGAEGLALAAYAGVDGRWAAVLFQDRRLFLIDTEEEQMNLADVDQQGAITAAAFGENGRLWVASREQKVTEYVLGDRLEPDRRINPSLDFQQKAYYYFIKPAYTICPKPGEFYKTVTYLLLDGDDDEAVTGAATRAIRAELDPWAPVWSGALFIAVMLGLACIYIERQDF